MSDKDLREALDALYAGAPSDFTKARDALARSLTKAGDKEAAAAVKRRTKPTLVAHALNQLARRHPEDIEALVDVGRTLSRAQRKALRGEASGDLREAIAEQRRTLQTLTAKASAVLRDLAIPTSHLPSVVSGLQSALVDPSAAEALEAGQLESVPERAATDLLGAAAPPALVEEPAAPVREAKKTGKSARSGGKTADTRKHAAPPAPKRDLRAEKAARAAAARDEKARRAEEARAARKAAAEARGSKLREAAAAAQEAAKEATEAAAAATREARRLAAEAKTASAEARSLRAEARRRAVAADRARKAAARA